MLHVSFFSVTLTLALGRFRPKGLFCPKILRNVFDTTSRVLSVMLAHHSRLISAFSFGVLLTSNVCVYTPSIHREKHHKHINK